MARRGIAARADVYGVCKVGSGQSFDDHAAAAEAAETIAKQRTGKSKMRPYQTSIGKDAAVALAATCWWESKTDREIALFQMQTVELSMPFSRFHESLEKSLGRPVFTHELGLNFDGIYAELIGEKEAPTFAGILEMIPVEKRIVVSL